MRKLDKFKHLKAGMTKAMRLRVLACEQVPEDLQDLIGVMMKKCLANAKTHLRQIEAAKPGTDLQALWKSWVDHDQALRTEGEEP